MMSLESHSEDGTVGQDDGNAAQDKDIMYQMDDAVATANDDDDDDDDDNGVDHNASAASDQQSPVTQHMYVT